MPKTTVIATLVAVCLAGANARAQGADPFRAYVEKVNAAVVKAYASGDIDTLASHFAAGARQFPPHQPPLVGKEAIRAYWKQAVGWGHWDFTLRTEETATGGEVGVERGSYTLAFKPGPGAPPGMGAFVDKGNYLVHWARAGDRWLIVNDMPTPETPFPTCPTAPPTP